MAVAPSFPLYELPKDELRWVLKAMEPGNLFKLSLLSKRSKDLVTSRNWKAAQLYIHVGQDGISIRCCFDRFSALTCNFYINDSFPIEIVNSNNIIFYYRWDGPHYKWRKEGFEANDWLDHFKTTFRLKEFGIRFWDYAAIVNIDSLYKQFGTPTFLSIRKNFGHDINNRILKVLAPKNNLYATSSIFENWHKRNTIFIQTLDELEIYGHDPSFTLDHLLCINAKTFIYLVSRGIPYKIVPKEQNKQRRFKTWDGRLVSFHGEGMDIHRFDGTKATVCIIQTQMNVHLNFHVWHDHCIVNNVV